MKLHYIGVCFNFPTATLLASPLIPVDILQIFRNDSKPAHEIVAEKELSDYSRFTKSKYAAAPSRQPAGLPPPPLPSTFNFPASR